MIREIIEARARESAEKLIGPRSRFSTTFMYESYLQEAIGAITDTAIAILTDPQVGFKEALEAVPKDSRVCGCYVGGQFCAALAPNDYPKDVHCFCPCHTAAEKLKELEELSK